MLLTVFVFLAVAAVSSAIVVVLHRNPVFSTMSLVVTLVATAGLFIMLGSPFLAALQILLYTGAILVLFLFVIMLLNVQRERTAVTRASGMLVAAGICAMVFAGVAGPALLGRLRRNRPCAPLEPGSISLVGVARELFSTYILPFEMIGLLLLVAVVAASWVAQKANPAAPAARRNPIARRGRARAAGRAAMTTFPSPGTWCWPRCSSASATFGALTRRSGIAIFLSIELMLNAANLTLVAYSRIHGDSAGQMFVFFALAVAAAEAAVGLGLFISIYRLRHTIDVNRLNRLRW